MTILIADDEKLVRYTLKSMLKEIGIPSSSIQVACDGQEMVEKVADIRPDLALVDIKMPRLDGLEAIQRARGLSPHTRWIILTSYSTFEYAKQAVALGATAYLLKPVSPQELRQTIQQVTQANRGIYQRLNDEFEAHLNALLQETTTLAHEGLDYFTDAVLWGSLLVFDSNIDRKDLVQQEHLACDYIRKKMASVIDQTTRIALCRLGDGQLALIGAWTRGQGERKSRGAIRDLLRKLQLSLNSMAPPSVCCTIILGERSDSYAAFDEHLRLLTEIAPLRTITGIGGAIPWIALQERRGFHPEVELSKYLIALSATVRESTYLEYLKLVDEIAVVWKGMRDSRRTEIKDQVLRFLEISLGFRPTPLPYEDAWSEELRCHGKQLFENTAARKSKDNIDQVVEFIDRNYMKDIGVAQIANDLGLTPNYLSHRFHKKTGTTFVKYLTQLRITKAKELLADPLLPIQQIARKVGYNSSRHFSSMFKLLEGRIPSDFRRDRERND
ncbi:MAG: response regulator [Spirochaetaceae bacterium]|nr:MAG: response regulator [Spirochaetaceae bacterium]